MNAEQLRLDEDRQRVANWKRWGPYLSERQWATVREDYSVNGDAWSYFPHDHARSRAYRWGEDGLFGISDRECRLCFALALWNGKDPILKERLFGLTGPEGNHGEDVKECYYYIDSTPTHSYMKALYKYPQSAFPYDELIQRNRAAGLHSEEVELTDTTAFAENHYFDVFAEYAKASLDDILIRFTIYNRGPEEAAIHLLPTVWFRNTWSWGCKHEGCSLRPSISYQNNGLNIQHRNVSPEPDYDLGEYQFYADAASTGQAPEFLFTHNQTNYQRLYGTENDEPWTKDAFHRYVIEGEQAAINPKKRGTKAAAYYQLTIPVGGKVEIRLRLFQKEQTPAQIFGDDFDALFTKRIEEADLFYAAVTSKDPEKANVQRQAYAGLLWSKQFYHYIVEDWLQGDPYTPTPPADRKGGRNVEWKHAYARDIISMPDKWEYSYFCSWDSAFHMVAFANIDPEYAKQQLLLFLREWYLHPNGQLPAYEFNYSDVNPPVHAWAAWRLYNITKAKGNTDREFLERVFQKLLLNFTWWVNRKDSEGNNLFSGGFLGLDNIGVFDRSRPLPTGGHLHQADGTAWMGFFCLTLLAMALELALPSDNQIVTAYEDMASKLFEHFIQIVDAINTLGGHGLWDEEDSFYYDRIRLDNNSIPLKTRSLVGLMPLIAVEILQDTTINALPGFRKRLDWFLRHRTDLARFITYCEKCTVHHHRLLSIPSKQRLERVLAYLFDENEFLSPFGIRSLSKYHLAHPYIFECGTNKECVQYNPAESNSYLFGGNSNWRGPVWFPINYLIIEALERYHRYYGNDLLIEVPTGSGNKLNLKQAADELARRLSSLFLPDESAHRPCHGKETRYATDPHWKNLILFYEYFHGDNGRGCGASHQTGWTALVARLLDKG